MTYIFGDIHDVIKSIETDTIDLIYTNPPYGTTENKWDKSLDWDALWPDIWRILKPNGVVIIHASKPFTYKLIQSQTPKYHYTWKKNISTNFFHAKKQPLRQIEEILIFYKNRHTYNPQMIGNEFKNKIFLIKTIRKKGETKLDMTTHNKVVGDIVIKLDRKFIGVDIVKF